MALYNFTSSKLEKVAQTSFNAEGILERQHLQQALKKNIEIIAPDCLVIAEEFSEWSDSQRRIDLLAIDKAANLVVIELKRSDSGEHMELQALRYAAMVSTLTFSRAAEIYQKYLQANGDHRDAKSALFEFLSWGNEQEENFASDTRIVLVSSGFSMEITTSVMWLNQRNLDVRCIRLIPYKYKDSVFIDVQQIIPLPEAESYQIKIRQQSEERREVRESLKDFTQYRFEGGVYKKRKLVLAVIQSWCKTHCPNTLEVLLEAFPQSLQGSALMVPESEAKEIHERWNIPRHFLGEGEIITFSDNSRFAISNQWGKGNIENFIQKAQTLGFQIEAVVQ
jgi:hypothetical protein